VEIYFAVDTDGDPTPLIPLLMDAGVDTIWPIERASGVSPQVCRKHFGKGLRLWGGVDRRKALKRFALTSESSFLSLKREVLFLRLIIRSLRIFPGITSGITWMTKWPC